MPKAPPSTLLSRVGEVLISLNTPGGSTRQQVTKALGNIPESDITICLASGVKKGAFIKIGAARFYRNGYLPPTPPPAPTVTIEDTTVGTGAVAVMGSRCTMGYAGRLASNGVEFDSSSKFVFELGAGEVIKGWDAGILNMKVGGVRRLTVPPELGYGKRGSAPEIPPSATLIFDVRLLAVA